MPLANTGAGPHTLRILFFDDDSLRHSAFSWTNGKHDITYASNTDDAIKVLGEKDFDVVFLDHDLGGEVSQNRMDCEDDGRIVARWIAEHAGRFQNTTFIVHSLNIAGSTEMVSILKDAGLRAKRQPFAWKDSI